MDISGDPSFANDHAKHNRVRFPEIAHGTAPALRALVVGNDYDRPPALAVGLLQKVPGRFAEGLLNRTATAERAAEHSIPDALFGGAKISGEVGNQICFAIEGHYGDAVAWAKFSEGRMPGLGHTPDHGAHAGAGVEEQNYIQRFFLVPKIQDCLRLPAFGYQKALLFKIVDEPAPLTDFRVHMHQRNIAAEGRLILSEQEE
jgi:hypothetical protein